MSENEVNETPGVTAEPAATPQATADDQGGSVSPTEAATPGAGAPIAGGESHATPDSGKTDLALLRDVELKVTAELGRAKMTIGEVSSLTGGSIVTLNKGAGEPADLRINDQLFASGEVIVVDGYFAVKITKLLSKEERVKHFS